MTEEDRYTRITLRIPKEMHQRLTKSASERSHSMNAEIVQRLESTFKVQSSYLDDDDAYEVAIYRAEMSVRHLESELEKAPKDIDPIEKAIIRYELRKAERHLEDLKEDFTSFMQAEKIFLDDKEK